MFDKALVFLRDQINAYVRLKTSSPGDLVLLQPIVDPSNGSVSITSEHVGMALVNVEEERVLRGSIPQMVQTGNTYSVANPELRVNLYVMFAAYHNNRDLYNESLKQLAYVMQFFQWRSSFNNQEAPLLGDEIEFMTAELFTLNFEQQNQLWASLGAKYMPSVVYKIRMLVLNEKRPSGTVSAVGTLTTGFAGNRE